MKTIFIKSYFLFILLISINESFAQDYKDYLSSYWDDYYTNNPSGIAENFQASDFIRVIDLVEFVPSSSITNRNVNILKKGLLKLEFAALKQMSITGDFYSRSKKHEDYFQLYNLTYKPISKAYWINYCSYLIPLMEIDGVIKLH